MPFDLLISGGACKKSNQHVIECDRHGLGKFWLSDDSNDCAFVRRVFASANAVVFERVRHVLPQIEPIAEYAFIRQSLHILVDHFRVELHPEAHNGHWHTWRLHELIARAEPHCTAVATTATVNANY
jgi:hypothetical protein